MRVRDCVLKRLSSITRRVNEQTTNTLCVKIDTCLSRARTHARKIYTRWWQAYFDTRTHWDWHKHIRRPQNYGFHHINLFIPSRLHTSYNQQHLKLRTHGCKILRRCIICQSAVQRGPNTKRVAISLLRSMFENITNYLKTLHDKVFNQQCC